MSRKTRLYTAIIAISLLNVGLWSLIGINKAYAGRLQPGTIIHGENVSGLTKAETFNRLRPVHEKLEQQAITITIGAKTITTSLEELGYQISTEDMINSALKESGAKHAFLLVRSIALNTHHTVETKLKLDQEKQNAFIEKLQVDFTTEPKDISLDYQNGTLVVTPPEMGTNIDPEIIHTSLDTSISQAFNKNKSSITLPHTEEKPILLEEAQITQAKSFVEKIVARPLSIKAEDQTFQIAPETIFSFILFTAKNNQLEVAFDETKIKTQVDAIAKKVNVTPQAKKVSSSNNLTLAEGRDGRKLNTTDAVNQIVERLKSATFDPPIVLAADKIERQTVTEHPEYELGRVQGKYLEVDLSSQRIYLISDQTIDLVTSVSTGKWSTPTPIGEFTIKNHIRTAWSSRYKLYMPYWMAIQKPDGDYDGYGIHGLPYWPSGYVEGESHIGRPASHGCIRVGSANVQYVYDWVQDGTKVYIHE